MKESKSKIMALASSILALVIGYLHLYYALEASSFSYSLNPVGDILLSLGITGTGFRVAIWPSELLINTAIAIPAALALLLLRPKLPYIYALLAGIPILLSLFSRFVEPSLIFFTVIAAQFPAIFLATCLIQVIANRPNYAIKGTSA
jgi:hypothetical protein